MINQVDAIKALRNEIPLTDFGLPTGIFRPDMLPYHDYKPPSPRTPSVPSVPPTPLLEPPVESAVPSQALQVSTADTADTGSGHEYRIAGFPAESVHKAFVPLEFEEGIPVFNNGLPFWCRMDYEPLEAFQAFNEYLQMQRGRPGTDEDEDYGGVSASGVRGVAALAEKMYNGKAVEMLPQLQEFYHLYYWGARSRAYDLYRVAQHRQSQELRAMETQDEHYVLARRIMHRLRNYFDEDELCWDLMTPAVATKLLAEVAKLERVSAGLPAAGPAGEAQSDRAGTPFEMLIRTLSNDHRVESGTTVDEEGNILEEALQDSNSVGALQELILRFNGGA